MDSLATVWAEIGTGVEAGVKDKADQKESYILAYLYIVQGDGL